MPDAASRRRRARRARRAGYGVGMDVAGRGACPPAVPVRSHAARAPRPAPGDRHRGRRGLAGRLTYGRRGHVRGNSAGQRTDAQHPDAGRVQRHADASRVARGAPGSKRGGGSDRRPHRRERPAGGRRAVPASRDPSRERRGRLPRSALVPPREAGGVSPRAAGPSRNDPGRCLGAAAWCGAAACRSGAARGTARRGAGRSGFAAVVGLSELAECRPSGG